MPQNPLAVLAGLSKDRQERDLGVPWSQYQRNFQKLLLERNYNRGSYNFLSSYPDQQRGGYKRFLSAVLPNYYKQTGRKFEAELNSLKPITQRESDRMFGDPNQWITNLPKTDFEKELQRAADLLATTAGEPQRVLSLGRGYAGKNLGGQSVIYSPRHLTDATLNPFQSRTHLRDTALHEGYHRRIHKDARDYGGKLPYQQNIEQALFKPYGIWHEAGSHAYPGYARLRDAGFEHDDIARWNAPNEIIRTRGHILPIEELTPHKFRNSITLSNIFRDQLWRGAYRNLGDPITTPDQVLKQRFENLLRPVWNHFREIYDSPRQQALSPGFVWTHPEGETILEAAWKKDPENISSSNPENISSSTFLPPKSIFEEYNSVMDPDRILQLLIDGQITPEEAAELRATAGTPEPVAAGPDTAAIPEVEGSEVLPPELDTGPQRALIPYDAPPPPAPSAPPGPVDTMREGGRNIQEGLSRSGIGQGVANLGRKIGQSQVGQGLGQAGVGVGQIGKGIGMGAVRGAQNVAGNLQKALAERGGGGAPVEAGPAQGNPNLPALPPGPTPPATGPTPPPPGPMPALPPGPTPPQGGPAQASGQGPLPLGEQNKPSLRDFMRLIPEAYRHVQDMSDEERALIQEEMMKFMNQTPAMEGLRKFGSRIKGGLKFKK